MCIKRLESRVITIVVKSALADFRYKPKVHPLERERDGSAVQSANVRTDSSLETLDGDQLVQKNKYMLTPGVLQELLQRPYQHPSI